MTRRWRIAGFADKFKKLIPESPLDALNYLQEMRKNLLID